MNEEKRIKELQKEIDGLRKQQSPLLNERNKLQSKINLEKNIKLLGKCFKTKNYYSNNQKWDLYTKIVDTGDWDITLLQAEIDVDGNVSIRTMLSSASYVGTRIDRERKEISSAEFEKQFNKILAKAKEMQK